MVNFMNEQTDLNIYNQSSSYTNDRQFHPVKTPNYPQESYAFKSDLKPNTGAMLMQDV